MARFSNYIKIPKLIKKKYFKLALFVLIGLIATGLLCLGVYSAVFAKKVYAHQYIGNTNYSGKTKAEVKSILGKQVEAFLGSQVELKWEQKAGESKTFTVAPKDIGLQFDLDATTNSVWNYGRGENVFNSFWQQLKSVFRKSNHNTIYSSDEESLNKKIAGIAVGIDNPEKDFSLIYSGGKFTLSTERQGGSRIDQDEIISNIKNRIANTSFDQITFQSKEYNPQISQANAEKRLAQANAILTPGDLVLSYNNRTFPADTDTLGSFISSKTNGDDLEIIYKEDRIKLFVETIATNIDLDSQNAQLKVADGKVVVFQIARLGAKLDQTQTKVDIKNALFARMNGESASNITLNVAVLKPDITDDAVNNLGLNELVGTGTTDFKKSPSNRVHNIQIGASAINGALVKPGEEFSTLGKLGAIDASTGYLPELVIKNNQTVPDYGGGLCQVSTTLFRAALNAGLKITERQNHSYRVSYYEPPIGMDATIYDPSPDFKFVNTYDHYIFIQSHIDGTKITFDVYGTKDSRVVTISNPTAYDYVEPPARIDTPTDTLPAGESQQVQKPHQGASAKFQYKVVKDGQTLQDKIFTSVYVALPEKWLIGIGAAPAPAAPAPTCSDGIQNGDETGVDCGGSCTACPVVPTP